MKYRSHQISSAIIGSCTRYVVLLFSLHAAVGLVRTMEHAYHSTTRTAMCAFAQKDTEGNIAKQVMKFSTVHKALVKRRMIVDDSLTHATIINYHQLSCTAWSNGKKLSSTLMKKFEQVQIR